MMGTQSDGVICPKLPPPEQSVATQTATLALG
jgi:hypothetical protein